jgi:hypothetical protein
MPNKPILIFPRVVSTDYTRGERNIPAGSANTPAEQGAKLKGRWQEVEAEWNQMTLSDSMTDSISEMVLVLEVKGSIESFYSAVRETEELQFLGEEFDFIPENTATVVVDEESDPYAPTDSRIFLTLQNESSLRKIIELWNRYLNGGEYERGLGRYALLFQLLEDVRVYSVKDRLRDTGLEQYVTTMHAFGQTSARIEIELLYRTKKYKPAPITNKKGTLTYPSGTEEFDNDRTYAIYESFKTIVEASGGNVIEGSRIVIPEIQYHAVIADIPLDSFEDLSDNTEVELLQATQVMYFRPLGQTSWIGKISGETAPAVVETIPSAPIPQGEPIAALFDGLPLQNHIVLANRLVVDAEGVDETAYPAAGRFHGTAMSTIITRGDLNDINAQPLKNKLYVRPVMVPVTRPDGIIIEEFPANKLPIDVVHQAVRRLFERDGDEAPVAPKVKIINLSIGDPYRPFFHTMSAWARLIDWLSYKYQVLFIISAGNINDDIKLSVPTAAFDASTPDDIRNEVLKHIVSDNLNRKILTPSESINSITVGSSQGDAGASSPIPSRYVLINDSTLISPISRIGFGYRASIKPDILMPGGRKSYKKQILQANPLTHTTILIEDFPFSFHPPGIRVAIPLPAGRLDSMAYQWGTSNSAALATRLACQLHEMLDSMNTTASEDDYIPEKYFTAIIKTLLVHGAKWSQGHEELADIVSDKLGVPSNYTKKHVTPYLGYGVVNGQRVLYCTDSRVTLLGWGELKKEKAHEYTFPLPKGIETRAIYKSITVTLGWLSPINWQTRKYRKARLYFENITGEPPRTDSEQLTLEREGVDYHTARRGTIQHDILSGRGAEAYINDGNLIIKINCREDAQGLSTLEMIPYGIAVTFEVEESDGIPIYDEVKQRISIQPRVKLR